MSVVRWRLGKFLEERQLTAYAVSKASGIERMSTVYRIANPKTAPVRVDLPTLAAIIDGLRQLTGEEIQLTDVLEYVPGTAATKKS